MRVYLRSRAHLASITPTIRDFHFLPIFLINMVIVCSIIPKVKGIDGVNEYQSGRRIMGDAIPLNGRRIMSTNNAQPQVRVMMVNDAGDTKPAMRAFPAEENDSEEEEEESDEEEGSEENQDDYAEDDEVELSEEDEEGQTEEDEEEQKEEDEEEQKEDEDGSVGEPEQNAEKEKSEEDFREQQKPIFHKKKKKGKKKRKNKLGKHIIDDLLPRPSDYISDNEGPPNESNNNGKPKFDTTEAIASPSVSDYKDSAEPYVLNDDVPKSKRRRKRKKSLKGLKPRTLGSKKLLQGKPLHLVFDGILQLNTVNPAR